jgi:hypothetical protein
VWAAAARLTIVIPGVRRDGMLRGSAGILAHQDGVAARQTKTPRERGFCREAQRGQKRQRP